MEPTQQIVDNAFLKMGYMKRDKSLKATLII
jgi:hypothetical protein